MRSRSRSSLLVCLVLGALAICGQASTAAAAGQSTAIKALNVQRAANGLPLAIPEDTTASAGCAAHDSYMHRNNVFDHGENPALPGYSTLGDIFKQPYGEVLSEGGSDGFANWLSSGIGPWEDAPIHLFLLLDPSVSAVGADESYSFDCMRMAYDAAPSGFYSYPGPERTNVPAAEQASESPYVPQEKVGIPASQTTGPNILLWGSCSLTSASLASSSGAVVAKLAGQAQLPDFFYNGGDLIPVKPLDYFTRYTVSARWACGTQTFSFTTAGRTNQVQLNVNDGSIVPDRVVLQVDSNAPSGTATITGANGQTITVPLHKQDGGLASKPLTLVQGHYKACVTTGSQASGYETSSACQEFDHPGLGADYLTISKLSRHGATVIITIKARGPALGQKLWVSGILMTGCGQPACGGSIKHSARTARLKVSQTFSFPAPQGKAQFEVHLTLLDFTAAGIGYSGVEIYRYANGR